jgi:hypothetical protein
MTDRPIIFSAPMVKALIEGRKTQTRRILKPRPEFCGAGRSTDPQNHADRESWGWQDYDAGCWRTLDERDTLIRPTFYLRDRLWVREAVRAVEHEDGTDAVEYLADAACVRIDNTMQAADRWLALYHYGARGPDRKNREGQKVPSIHMPRWASRLTLTVTAVRVQRLQDISEADAEAEGIQRLKSGRGFYDPTVSKAAVRFGEWTSTARQGFCRLWNSIHGPDAWDANPWVCAISFTVEQRNIDA